jgi:hypothetical protein
MIQHSSLGLFFLMTQSSTTTNNILISKERDERCGDDGGLKNISFFKERAIVNKCQHNLIYSDYDFL